ncbi:MAG TPA: lactate dehydrogenase [Methanoregulaceae archaeon]|nr:lactate dehydrogenase [Methanoregulaceae archaeon]
MTCLSVLGTGRIGGEVAYLASILGLIDHLILCDINKPLLDAQILDLMHTGLDIDISTDPGDAKESDICIFSAGFPRDPTIKTRADLLHRNLPVARECSELLHDYIGILITVTNPMDVNNYFLWKYTGIDSRRCIGFGGQLDSARFALALKRRSIRGQAWVLGDHGEHQVPVFSSLPEPVPADLRGEILAELKGASMEVIKGKGGTVFGPVWHIAGMIRMIRDDSRSLVPCSCILDGEYGVRGCSLGVPARIGRNGIHRIEEWKLDEWEQAGFNEAAENVQQLYRSIND